MIYAPVVVGRRSVVYIDLPSSTPERLRKQKAYERWAKKNPGKDLLVISSMFLVPLIFIASVTFIFNFTNSAIEGQSIERLKKMPTLNRSYQRQDFREQCFNSYKKEEVLKIDECLSKIK